MGKEIFNAIVNIGYEEISGRQCTEVTFDKAKGTCQKDGAQILAPTTVSGSA